MEIEELFKGKFLTSPANIKTKLEKIKAYIFDWDGVFNNGIKFDSTSLFNEVDAMGINMIRFNHYKRKGTMPIMAIITGERNTAAHALADREHFESVYYKIKHKSIALEHLNKQYNILPEEVAFVFDDILDLDVSAQVGIRIMVQRQSCNPLLIKYALDRNLVDYLTANDGNHNAIREASELLMGLTGIYNETLDDRIAFNDLYRKYINTRNAIPTEYYTIDGDTIIAKKL
jgi:3-deoxy-D-manno-octulosonate 8-phosphate phosphatase (KDO 8-P phosphatase)